VPGIYSIRLTVNGKPYTQPITVKMDPRVKNQAALEQQFALSKRVYDAIARIHDTLPAVQAAREKAQAAGNTDLAEKLQALAGAGGGGRGRGAGGGRGRGGAGGAASLSSVSAQLTGVYGSTQDGNGPPPTQTIAAVEAALKDYDALMAQVATLLK
jgi:hypothetical protein